MDRQEEPRTAWELWQMLTDVTQRLWERYEDDFVKFCIEEEELGHDKQRRDASAPD